MKKIISLLLVFFIAFPLTAQKKKSKKKEDKSVSTESETIGLDAFSLRNIGPALTSGRIADIAVDPRNSDHFYIAVASGGVWETLNNAVSWSPIFDSEVSFSIGCIAINPHNPNEIWVGSGENNNQRSVGYGDGIYRSDDGGKSWKNMGLKKSEHIGMIAFDSDKPNRVYAAAYGPLWSSGGDRGVYRSDDSGETWDKILDAGIHTGFNEVHLHPKQNGLLFATAHQRARHVFTYLGGGPESALYKSLDNGETWNKVTNGLPTGDAGRLSLAISPVNSDVLFLLVEGHGTYKSTDRGASWDKQSDHSTSGNYYAELVAHPTELNTLYSLDTWCQVSYNGGKSFENVPEKAKHVDNHCLWINPKNINHMRMGCDGGFYQTYDRGENWLFSANLPITQFYRVSTDNALPFYNVYGGTQDNFSLKGPSRTRSSHGIANSDWVVTNTGDGFETQVDPKNENIVYAQAQYGWLVRFDASIGEEVSIKPIEPLNTPAWRWNWDAPLLISPHDNKRLYFCANVVFKSDNRGNSWEVISPDLSKGENRNEFKIMNRYWGSDAIAKNKSTSIYGNIVAFAESPIEEGLLFAGTDDGLIHRKESGSTEWIKSEEFPGIPSGAYVQGIWPSKHDRNIVYAAFNHHKYGDFKPYILKSVDGGKSWSTLQSNLPERGTVYAFSEDHLEENLLFVGTEFGLFTSWDSGKNWQALKNGLPPVAVKDIEIQERENDLVLATFGRGFYILDDYSPLRQIEKLNEEEALVFNVKTAMLFNPSRPLGYSGSGFQGAGFYLAPNPKVGVQFTYYNPETIKTLKDLRKEKEKKQFEDGSIISYPSSAELQAEELEMEPYHILLITNQDSKEIIRLRKSQKKGISRWLWNGRYPSKEGVSTKEGEVDNRSTSFVPEGQYFAQLHTVDKQGFKAIGNKQSFMIAHLKGAQLPASDSRELNQFQREADRISAQLAKLESQSKRLSNDLGHIKSNTSLLINMPTSAIEKISRLELQMDNLKVKLYGNSRIQKLEFETKPGLTERMGAVLWNSYYSSSEPTEMQRENLRLLQTQLPELEKELNDTEKEAKLLYDELVQLGMPELNNSLESH